MKNLVRFRFNYILASKAFDYRCVTPRGKGRAGNVGPLNAAQPSIDIYVQKMYIFATLPSYVY